MRRREFLKELTVPTLGTSALMGLPRGQPHNEEQGVKTVYVVTKCHLDVGFTDTERSSADLFQ
jgi:hypothetical protein